MYKILYCILQSSHVVRTDLSNDDYEYRIRILLLSHTYNLLNMEKLRRARNARDVFGPTSNTIMAASIGRATFNITTQPYRFCMLKHTDIFSI